MNKAELIDHIAQQADIPKVAATRALDAFIDAVSDTLKKDGSLTLVGFGTFSVSQRPARNGRDPRSGESIIIKAGKLPKFKAGKLLRDAVNQPASS
ncbi:MAG: hypothetical protein RL748_333 [Pseudomonadota bacterium]